MDCRKLHVSSDICPESAPAGLESRAACERSLITARPITSGRLIDLADNHRIKHRNKVKENRAGAEEMCSDTLFQC